MLLLWQFSPTVILIVILASFLLNNLLSNLNQSESDSGYWVSQLHAVTPGIFGVLDYNSPLEVRSVFLDESKAIDKVWHISLLYKLKSISGELYNLLEKYLSGTSSRFQKSCFKQTTFFVESSSRRCSPRSILSPLLFLIFIIYSPN